MRCFRACRKKADDVEFSRLVRLAERQPAACAVAMLALLAFGAITTGRVGFAAFFAHGAASVAVGLRRATQ